MTSKWSNKKNEDYSGVANSVVQAFVQLSTSTEAYLAQAGGDALRHAQSRAPFAPILMHACYEFL
jgi:hypothetical protein